MFSPSQFKILILDAHLKQTLGMVRSLGKHGFYLVTGAPKKRAQSFYSKYCKERVIYPSPPGEKEFVEFLLEYIKNKGISFVIPVGNFTTLSIAKYQNKFIEHTTLPLPNYATFEIAWDKAKTLDLAKELGIKIPKIYKSAEEVRNYPVVAKGTQGSGKIRYINSPLELRHYFLKNDILLEEYIPGEGFGFFALFNHGEPRAFFMHKRLRELPITGGPSTAAMSIYDPVLKELGLRILKVLNWHGVAMVEFKKDYRDGEFKLMEINPRFWGSLDLAIASGVDFPYLLVKMLIEGDIPLQTEYKVGIKFVWPFPDDFIRTIASPSSFGRFVKDLLNPKIKTNICSNDIKPNLYLLLETVYMLALQIRRERWRYPHGFPQRTR